MSGNRRKMVCAVIGCVVVVVVVVDIVSSGAVFRACANSEGQETKIARTRSRRLPLTDKEVVRTICWHGHGSRVRHPGEI